MADKQNYILPSIMSQTTGKKYFFSKMLVVALSAVAVIFILNIRITIMFQ